MIDLNLCFTESWCFLKDRYNSGRCWGSNHWGRSWLASFPLDPRLLESGPSSLSLRRAKLKPRLRELVQRHFRGGVHSTFCPPHLVAHAYMVQFASTEDKKKRKGAPQKFFPPLLFTLSHGPKWTSEERLDFTHLRTCKRALPSEPIDESPESNMATTHSSRIVMP